MAVRIYSLAKELKLDSKELVDLCARAGIQDKGSALASLSDEEVSRVKEFIAGKSKTAERPAATRPAAKAAAKSPGVMRREDYVAPTGAAGRSRPQELKTGKPAPKPAPLGRAPSASAAASGRDDAGTEGGDAGPPLRVRPGMGRSSRTGAKPAPRPTFKLPPLPAAGRKPTAPPPSQEPAAQKPDVKLPLDAIRSAKAGGTKPLAEHMRKHEQRQQEKPASRTDGLLRGGMAGGGLAPPLPPTGAGGRSRKAAKGNQRNDDLLGGREMRQLTRKRHDRRGLRDDDERGMRRRRPRQRRGSTVSTAAPRKTNASIQVPCTVRAFSEAIGLAASEVLRRLLTFGLDAVPNMSTMLDQDTVELLAAELGVQLDIKTPEDLEKELLAGFDAVDEDPELQQSRAPVVTFLGHVDHGKTSLLDKILGANVAGREHGGITQHMRAYTIEHNGQPISFVDTPGHEAFTQMRARGANVTDCAVLVVAADDGIMPQTEEAISHARAANVPIVVCINKIDLPGADIDRVYQQLAANELLPTEWGGDTEVVKTSALTGEGVNDLLDMLLTIAELHDLRANPDRLAAGVCLDASLHEGRGVVACLLVQKGTLRVGDAVVCGEAYGTVKSMHDTLKNRRVKEAGPSRAVMVAGFDVPPGAGARFQVVDEISMAREVAGKREGIRRQTSLLARPVHVTFENLADRLGTQQVPTLNLILRADVRGSIEAILKELEKLEHPEVRVRVLQASVGGISEADVQLADASDAVVIGFNVVPDDRARSLADERGVQIRRYDIIYQVTDDLRQALEGMLAPEKQEVELGRAVVQRTFSISRIGVIAGCRVIGGIISRNGRLRIIRDSRVIGDYPVETLRREKDDAKEVRDGLECGIKVAGFNDVKEGDILECYKIEEVARTLS
ncbi:MAG: translation initiation factor IF-2 [Planctomycetia bacterium]|nr:translation initiation factor IF-2 [Planctomycetia bacterium]